MQGSSASVTPSAIRIFLLLAPRSPLSRASLPSTFQELFGGQTLNLLKLTRYHTTTFGKLHSKKYVVNLGVTHIAFDLKGGI